MRSKCSSMEMQRPSFSICSSSPSTICWVSSVSTSRMRKLRSCTAILNACMYSQSPASTHLALPHWVFAAVPPQCGNRFQSVAVFSAPAFRTARKRSVHLHLGVLDSLLHFGGLLHRNTQLHFYRLPHPRTRGGPVRAVAQGLQRPATLY